MGMLRFSNDPPEIHVIPRIEDDLIDELFYQEDEIGEMRHTAFMIECGLEEDPPDGPDVEPIPWGDNYSDSSSVEMKDERPSSPKKERKPPKRVASMDDADDIIRASPREPRRKLVAAKSGTLHGMRTTKGPEKPQSADNIDLEKSPVRRKLVAAKSGSLHGMRQAAKEAKDSKEDNAEKSPGFPRRKLVVTKSGTLHGMRKKPTDENDDKADSSSPKKEPSRGKLVATRSGTELKGARRNGETGAKRETRRMPAGKKATLSETDDSVHQARRKSQQLRNGTNKDSDEEDSDSDVSISDDESYPRGQRRLSRGSGSAVVSKDLPPKSPLRSENGGSNSIKSRITAMDDKNSEKNAESKDKEDVSSALKNLRNGKSSPAELLRNMQNGNRSGVPKKSNSVSIINVPISLQKPTNTSSVLPTVRERPPGTKRTPMRAKSTGNMDIPPAFRASANKDIPPAFRAIANK